jgi:hypothetical protein
LTRQSNRGPTFTAFLSPLKKVEWVIYAKESFAGPGPVLRYLSRYTHRVAISNRRLVAADDGGVAFRAEFLRFGRVTLPFADLARNVGSAFSN